MLIGEYIHALDSKKRLALPAKIRKELGEKIVMTRGLDQCLFIYPRKEWEGIADKLAKLPMGQADTRNFVRLMLAGAVEMDIDSLGRVLVPDQLKKYAGLEGRVVIVGVFNRVECWSQDRWLELKQKAEADADRLAERLGDLGVY